MRTLNRNHLYLLIWIALIAYASFTSPNGIPKINLFKNADKLVHFCMYFGFAVLLIPVASKNRYSLTNLVKCFLITASIGAIIECFQHLLTSTRHFSLYDMLFNALGAFCGIVFYRYLLSRSKLEKTIFKS
jgi:VanZ family protein